MFALQLSPRLPLSGPARDTAIATRSLVRSRIRRRISASIILFCFGLIAHPATAQSTSDPPEPVPASTDSGFSRVDRLRTPRFAPSTNEAVDVQASGGQLSRQDVEQFVLENHPAVRAAIERRRAGYGDWVQAGLRPNPTVGYIGGEIGVDGTAGQHGGYLQRTWIRGNKLGLDQAVQAHRIAQLDQAILKQQMATVRNARLAYFDLLVEQEKLKILDQLLQILEQSEETARRLTEANESPRTDYLQAKIQTTRLELNRRSTRVNLGKARRVLAAAMGVEQLPAEHVVGNVTDIQSSLVHAAILAEVESSHPDLIAAMAKVSEAQCQLARERAEVIPDWNAQASVQYDDGSRNYFAGVQTGVELKIWDRNQGAILRASRMLRSAEQELEQTRLRLRTELAERFAVYEAAQANAEQYRSTILPQAQETDELVERSYRNGESSILAVLTAQQTFFQTSLGYLETIRDYWTGWTDVNAMLIVGPLPTSR